MVEVNEQLTRKVADLARLELSDQEVQTFTTQLSKIIQYIESLQKVDVQGIEPLTHPLELKTPLREDRVLESPTDEAGKPKVLQSAPDVLYQGFKVPPIL